jgi:hypothetical protein
MATNIAAIISRVGAAPSRYILSLIHIFGTAATSNLRLISGNWGLA